MTYKKLTARAAIAIYNDAQKAKLKGGVEYKRYIKQVIDDYGIEKNDAFQIATGKNLLQIVARYEVESDTE